MSLASRGPLPNLGSKMRSTGRGMAEAQTPRVHQYIRINSGRFSIISVILILWYRCIFLNLVTMFILPSFGVAHKFGSHSGPTKKATMHSVADASMAGDQRERQTMCQNHFLDMFHIITACMCYFMDMYHAGHLVNKHGY